MTRRNTELILIIFSGLFLIVFLKIMYPGENNQAISDYDRRLIDYYFEKEKENEF